MHDITQIFTRQIDFQDLGQAGQHKLLHTKVGIVGAGGLGSNVALTLRSSGVGQLVIVDGDKIEYSNLPRQLYGYQDVGQLKVAKLKEMLETKYNFGQVQVHAVFLNEDNIHNYFDGCDVLLDCTDRLATRLMVGRFAHQAKVPLISAAVTGSDGQLLSLDHRRDPCPKFEDVISDKLKAKLASAPGQESGANPVLGSHVAVMAALQASETLNFLMYGTNASLNTLMHIDLKTLNILKLKLQGA